MGISDPVAGFWLPMPAGRFYPDFVFELHDCRRLLAEYKGDPVKDAPKEIEKARVGTVWADHSAGRAVFAMLYMLSRGLGLAQQIDAPLR